MLILFIVGKDRSDPGVLQGMNGVLLSLERDSCHSTWITLKLSEISQPEKDRFRVIPCKGDTCGVVRFRDRKQSNDHHWLVYRELDSSKHSGAPV